ncbi:MAG: hypothetical protein NC901_02870 [Candidatus Omnitrophica bacterium]|nr:hypothetical protein [Candidatus Omnitrophota bacterium]
MNWKFRKIEPGEINIKTSHRFEIHITSDSTLYFTNPYEGRVLVLKLIVEPGVKITWQNTNNCIIRMNDNTYYVENSNDTTDIVYLAFVVNKDNNVFYIDCIGMINEIKNIDELEG